MPVEFDVFYTLHGRAGRRSGRANDLSAGGLRLSTDEDFLHESVLNLDFQLPSDFLSELTVEFEPAPFAPMHVTGAVRSAFFVPSTKRLAYGLQFRDLEDTVKEELERFVHLWQVRQLQLRQAANR